MPNWQPNWQDVGWDHSAANEAIANLRHLADQLDQTAHERSRVAQDAQAEWRGRHRIEFDQLLKQMLKKSSALANEFRDAANRVAWASQRAHEEQQHRERERERWRREKEAEERMFHC